MAMFFHLGWISGAQGLGFGCLLAFIAVWTAELFLVQAATLVSPQDNSPRFARWAPRIRLLIDLSFVVAVTALVPRWWLLGISVAAFFVNLGLVSHYQYFLRPLSALNAFHNWREGVRFSGHRFTLRPATMLLLLGSVLSIKAGLLLAETETSLTGDVNWLVGLAALGMYLALLVVASLLDPLDKILTTRGIGRLGMIRGYFVTWLAEFYYLGRHEVLDSAVRQREIVCDRLTKIETSVPIRRQLVIIQAESLDHNVIGLEANGQEVTPFLNQLRRRSLFYRLAAARYIGSADADFVMLNGVLPSMHLITYNIPNYPYADTLPEFLSRFGFRTVLFHGNTGNFYNRRNAFEKMGFAQIRFEEELIREDHLPAAVWGVEDRDVLDLSERMLQEESGRVCHFLITLSTHTPYKLLGPADREIFPKPQTMAQDYLNNMRYLDNLLRDYVGALKSATVVIYSDHPADPATAPDFRPDTEGSREFVPCLIYDTDSDLGEMQRTRDLPLASDGSLTLLDISSFLRSQIATVNGDLPVVASKEAEGE